MKSKDVLEILITNNLTISFAESMTGGLATYEIVKHPNASKVLSESLITYSNESKIKRLNISKHLIDLHTVVSKEVSIQMAKAVRMMSQSVIGVGITGNAGPSNIMDTEAMTCYYSIDFLGEVMTTKLVFSHRKTRVDNIKQTVQAIYNDLFVILNDKFKSK